MSIHQKNLQVLATEIFKAKLNISPEISKELFSFNVRNYNFRSQSTLKRIKTNSVYFGSESLSSLAPKIWDLVPDSFKNENSLERFKNRIKTWTTDKSSCRICKYISAKQGLFKLFRCHLQIYYPDLFVLITNLFIICLIRL